MGDIHLKPNFGLSNRLRAISAALALANSSGRRLIVHWRDTDDCHADWKDLFETPGEFEVVDVRHSVTGNADDKFSANNPDYFDWRNTNEAIRACLAGDEKDVYIENFRRFFPGGDYDWIRPVKKIRDELDSILRTMPPRRIGIHIRRTDNMEAAFISPTELFADAVRNKLESEPETAIFLATRKNRFFPCRACFRTEWLKVNPGVIDDPRHIAKAKPKGAMITHADSTAKMSALRYFTVDRGDNFLVDLPLHHAFAFL